MLMESSRLLYRESLRTVPGVLGINDVSALKQSQTKSNLLALCLCKQPEQKVTNLRNRNCKLETVLDNLIFTHIP